MDIMSYLMGQNSAIKKGMKVIVVEELPETGEANVLYLVPKEDTGDNDIFEEWLYVDNDWEKIGSTDIDLSNYYTKSETDGITGLLTNLTTTNKTNLVSAINELVSNGSPIEVVDVTLNTDLYGYQLNAWDYSSSIYSLKNNNKVYLLRFNNVVRAVMFNQAGAPNGYTAQTIIGTLSSNDGITIASRSISNSSNTFYNNKRWLSNYWTTFSSSSEYIARKRDISNKEDSSNKSTSITSSSTDTQYPSAKAVWDLFNSITNANNTSY